MGFRYSRGRRMFVEGFGPSNEVSEEEYGVDDTQLIYPNVSSCTTITLFLSDRTLIGCHLTVGTSEEVVRAIFDRMIEVMGTRTVTGLYLVGALYTFGYGEGARSEAHGWLEERDFATPARMLNSLDAIFRGGVTRAGSFAHTQEDDARTCEYRVTVEGAAVRWESRVGTNGTWHPIEPAPA